MSQRIEKGAPRFQPIAGGVVLRRKPLSIQPSMGAIPTSVPLAGAPDRPATMTISKPMAPPSVPSTRSYASVSFSLSSSLPSSLASSGSSMSRFARRPSTSAASATGDSNSPAAATAPPTPFQPPQLSSVRRAQPASIPRATNPMASTVRLAPSAPVLIQPAMSLSNGNRLAGPEADSGISVESDEMEQDSSGATRRTSKSFISQRPSKMWELPAGHPPRPATAYFMFLKNRRSAIKQVNPDATVAEIAKLGGQEWIALSEQSRSEWQHKAREALTSYRAEVEIWRQENPEEARKLDEGSKGKKSKGDSKKSGPPRRPANAYQLYAAAFRSNDKVTRSSSADASANQAAQRGASQGIIANSWRDLSLWERQPYLLRAEELKTRYADQLVKWKRDYPDEAAKLPGDGSSAESIVSDGGTRYGRKRRHGAGPPKKTVSEDEREYEALVAEHGRDLQGLRQDPESISMADLAQSESRNGRVSDRTFDLERIREKQIEKAKADRIAKRAEALRQKASLRDKLERVGRGEQVELPKRAVLDSTGNALGRRYEIPLIEVPHANGNADEEGIGNLDGDEEEADVEDELGGIRNRRGSEPFQGVRDLNDDEKGIDLLREGGRDRSRTGVGGSDDDGDDDDDVAASDTGSIKTCTSRGTHNSLRENVHAPQMRIVDGRIVVDESSLNVMRSQDQVFDDADMIEEETGHKFVNSATASKQTRTPRWTKEETDEFFKGVSMWGTDFEMISRMFPNRNRKQIKAKWNREDRINGPRLDLAFKRKVSVNVAEYSVMANVDLSGPAPEVKVSDEDEQSLQLRQSPNKQADEDVKEDAHCRAGVDGSSLGPRKISQTPEPLRGCRGAQSDSEDDGDCHRRTTSVASTAASTVARGAAGGGVGVVSSMAAAAARKNRERKREERLGRERKRRRRASGARADDGSRSGQEEEVVDIAPDDDL